MALLLLLLTWADPIVRSSAFLTQSKTEPMSLECDELSAEQLYMERLSMTTQEQSVWGVTQS